MTALKLAVPTMGEASLDSERSGHFGHCDCFTLCTIEDGQITAVTAVQNPPHEEGGCLRPVKLLADAGADAIVAAGMGLRPPAIITTRLREAASARSKAERKPPGTRKAPGGFSLPWVERRCGPYTFFSRMVDMMSAACSQASQHFSMRS